MRGIGTLINVICIIVGGSIGCVFGNKLNERIQESLMAVSGVSVLFIAIGGVMERMLSVSGNSLTSGGAVMMVLNLAIGAVIGEILDIDGKVEQFGEWLKVKSNSTGDNSFVSGFVTASCTVSIGAMAIMGAIQDGITGDYSILVTKGILDAIIICIMAAAQGKGCVFSAIPVGVLQGSVTLIAIFAGSFMTEPAVNNLSYVGNVLIFCVGLNLIRDKKIRVANLLPSIVTAAISGFLF